MNILEDSIKEIVIFFSGGASLARYLIKYDPAYGRDYIFVCAFTDQADASGIAFFKENGIEVIVGTIEAFKKNNTTETPYKDYFAYYGKMIKTQYNPDLIFCCGFMKVIKKSFLDLFPEVVLNVHPADLREIHPVTKERIYVGDKAVELAYKARLPHMHSTIHKATKEVDGGPIVCVSPPYTVDYDNQTWEQVQSAMKDACDGPAGVEALRLFCYGEHPFN